MTDTNIITYEVIISMMDAGIQNELGISSVQRRKTDQCMDEAKYSAGKVMHIVITYEGIVSSIHRGLYSSNLAH